MNTRDHIRIARDQRRQIDNSKNKVTRIGNVRQVNWRVGIVEARGTEDDEEFSRNIRSGENRNVRWGFSKYRTAKATNVQGSSWRNRDSLESNTKINHNQISSNKGYTTTVRSEETNFSTKRERNDNAVKEIQPRRNRSGLGFNQILEWSEETDDDELIHEILGRRTCFEKYLARDMPGDVVVLTVKIFAKLCLSSTMNQTAIVSIITKEQFIRNLELFMMKLPLQTVEDRKWNKYFWNDIESFFNNLIKVLNAVIDTIPTRASEVLPKLFKALMAYIPVFEDEHCKLSFEIKHNIVLLNDKLEMHKSELEIKKKFVLDKKNYIEEDPPDDFRELSVYPSTEEIMNPHGAFVRKHVIAGNFDSVEHYLDVQFRLLKEDFVAPLREGVCDYLNPEKPKNSKFSNIRIHTNVIFLSPQFNSDQVGVLLEFPIRKSSTRNFAHSKRFMFGSLLCFTKDNFQTFLFGRVIDRNVNLLNDGKVTVGFESEYNDYELNIPYIMLECNVFFEPYYHVLKALQNMPENNFPMKDYLINVIPKVELPGYLNETSSFVIGNKLTFLSQNYSWPTSQQLQLDDTQYSAYRAALNQKFAVIQGPPGTGKTYLGLKIVKTLIENKSNWYNGTPILIICFTNHALDQFLEGLIGATKKIARVGGQSKNEKLEPFNLKNLRKGRTNRVANSTFFALKTELSTTMNQIKVLTENKRKAETFESVLDLKNFEHVDCNFANSWFYKASSEDILKWLFGGHSHPGRRDENLKAQALKIEQANAGKAANFNTADEDNEDMGSLLNNDALTLDIDDEIGDFSIGEVNAQEFKTLISKDSLIKEIQEINDNLEALENKLESNEEKIIMENHLIELEDKFQYLQEKLNEGKSLKIPPRPRTVDYYHPQTMVPSERWLLYFYWLGLYKEFAINQLFNLQHQHHEIYKKYLEIRNMEDTELMRSMLIIGMTTTGAARLQPTLQALKCQIVVVEEAAEVLEAHITVSLTSHCNHLILIGDHQQLRPTTATYRLEKDFNLGISMFERMVLNNIQCHRLGVQHRMRPEIAKLITPNIYPRLENHESVYNFPPVLGIDPSLFFLHHQHKEVEAGDSSKSNVHEAKFLIRLARYLIQNGYQPEDITILAAYSGQMFTLWNERKNYFLLKDVRITILDNYQGEECKIILLSLVRNNAEQQIGFLKNENRVCVALSRAKEGFYIMGNMTLLSHNSEIWPKIKSTLEEQNAIGKYLTLRCQIHSEEIIRATNAEDFERAPEGGCSRICGDLLNCQHTCTKVCHILDQKHEKTVCKFPCRKTLCERGHGCPKMCYEDCSICMVTVKHTFTCGHLHNLACHVDVTKVRCITPVKTTLPCGHVVNNKPCYEQTETYPCPYPCSIRVEPCGHSCQQLCHVKKDPDHLKYECHKPCTKISKNCFTKTHICQNKCYETCSLCNVEIEKMRASCSHREKIACSKNINEVPCIKPCKRSLNCDHYCKRQCFEECGGCSVMVLKTLISCGHQVKAKCSETANKKDCYEACTLKLNCGHPCKNKCNEPCTKVCEALVDHNKKVDCGHQFKIPCNMLHIDLASNDNILLKYCTQQCDLKLQCSHFCSGTCGKCYQGRIHETCQEKCGVPLICGHECPIPCREACQPCAKQCTFRCQHSKCKKKCGEPCTPCQERCTRRCEHIKCEALCGLPCTVPPCTKPCQKTIECGHLCVGFCGDPCPPLCRICHKDELTEIFLGYEDEDDARYVLLDECKHVIESQGMDGFFRSQSGGTNEEVNRAKCPKCHTTLTSTQRYSGYIKQRNKDVVSIIEQSFGTTLEIERKKDVLKTKIKHLHLKVSSHALRNCLNISTFLSECEAVLQISRGEKRQSFNLILGTTLEAKIQIVESILNSFESSIPSSKCYPQLWEDINQYTYLLIHILLKQLKRITIQETLDFERELVRIHRMDQFLQILNSRNYKRNEKHPQVIQLHDTIKWLLFTSRKNDQIFDNLIKEHLVKMDKLLQTNIGVITELEKQQIVRALGLSKGHWFKCPNGHYYIITECGGAMVKSVCNECKADIGGGNHALLSTNRHAGEMDGSTYAAYSETANNLFNYQDFND